MERLRVVNLGLPKSGTTTLGKALSESGLHTVDHRLHGKLTAKPELKGLFTAHVMYEDFFRCGDPLARLEEFDGFGEISALHDGNPAYPQMDAKVIEAIARHHPGVRFVASWRDPAALSASMVKWNNLVKRLERNSLPGLPVGYGGKEHERLAWIEGHYAFLDRFFGGDDIYLRLNVADPEAAELLGGHIGHPISWWGTANANTKAKDAPGASGTASGGA
ncbi:hypothetical protein [Pseudooceanicola sp.]|uniref:hypothetical protein n=1 Tax=Pseudooceanicola sp. TaxID=1914328 RepID=UPI0035C70F2A